MDLPKIDLESIPGLDTATGIFGSVTQAGPGFDDTIVAIMVAVYEHVPPSPTLGF